MLELSSPGLGMLLLVLVVSCSPFLSWTFAGLVMRDWDIDR